MKKILSLLLLAVVFASCSKDEQQVIIIENITVQFSTKTLLDVVELPSFGTRAIEDFTPVYPDQYKAYFVSNETKGQYTKGQLIKTVDVVSGTQSITIPKLEYNVYVTNYEQEGVWYTWNNAVEQMPQTSTTLYLYGKNNIDYSVVTEGTVEVKNLYAAVMILNNEWVTGIPYSYDTGMKYGTMGLWYYLYIRNDNTNTKVPVVQAYNGNYTLKETIEANKVYQYTFNGVGNTDGNFIVIVEEFTDLIEKQLDLW